MPKQPEGVVLVTGGTGAIGAPLLESYARDAVQVVVLGRSAPATMLPGIRFVTGEVERADLGLDPDVAQQLRSEITSIVHAAALTRFDAPVSAARATNVEGTHHVLNFAGCCPKLRSVVLLSTVYVAGKRTGRIREADLVHDCGFVNAYEQSKYEAERLARDAMPRLPLSVLRLSTVIGAHENGRVHRAGAIHHAMRFLYHSLLPMMPGRDDSPVDLISTEYAVAAIRQLSAAGFAAGTTRHICAADEALAQADLVDLVVDSFVKHRPAWRRRAIEKPSIVDLCTFELFKQSVDAVADAGLRSSVAVLAPFAPQLAYPKIFDDGEGQRAMAAERIRRPSLRETIPAVVRYLVEHDWAQAASTEVVPVVDSREPAR